MGPSPSSSPQRTQCAPQGDEREHVQQEKRQLFQSSQDNSGDVAKPPSQPFHSQIDGSGGGERYNNLGALPKRPRLARPGEDDDAKPTATDTSLGTISTQVSADQPREETGGVKSPIQQLLESSMEGQFPEQSESIPQVSQPAQEPLGLVQHSLVAPNLSTNPIGAMAPGQGVDAVAQAIAAMNANAYQLFLQHQMMMSVQQPTMSHLQSPLLNMSNPALFLAANSQPFEAMPQYHQCLPKSLAPANNPQQEAIGSLSHASVAASADMGAQHAQEPTSSGGPILYLPSDDEFLSDHQVLVRKQIELFEADEDDTNTIMPGRRKGIVLGQVGIRCRHCAKVPVHLRTKGAVYYPFRLSGLYQAAQNMAVAHLAGACFNISAYVKAQLVDYHNRKTASGHGGKQYWSDSARVLGVVETEEGLRFDCSKRRAKS